MQFLFCNIRVLVKLSRAVYCCGISVLGFQLRDFSNEISVISSAFTTVLQLKLNLTLTPLLPCSSHTHPSSLLSSSPLGFHVKISKRATWEKDSHLEKDSYSVFLSVGFVNRVWGVCGGMAVCDLCIILSFLYIPTCTCTHFPSWFRLT